MAKVKITGHASGSGVLTVTAPNTSSDRTITLPDATGTLATNENFTSTGIDDNADATAITITSAEKVGIGETVPLGQLHIKEGDSGASSISANGDQLVLEDDAHCGMHILSGTSSDGIIYFGDSGSSGIGQLKYQHSSNQFVFETNGSGAFTITSDGRGLSQFTAEAWANISGTGTPSLADSHNVSSVTDVGTGRYQLNWGTAIGNTAYSSVCSTAPGYIAGATNRGSASLEVQNGDTDFSLVDLAQVCCVIFGD